MCVCGSEQIHTLFWYFFDDFDKGCREYALSGTDPSTQPLTVHPFYGVNLLSSGEAQLPA